MNNFSEMIEKGYSLFDRLSHRLHLHSPSSLFFVSNSKALTIK
jgi:hypothetical protein